jgi:hypothetical protein
LIRKYFITAFLLVTLSGAAQAQHWRKIFSVPGIGSAASFYNPDAGCIGTGSYPSGYPAQIYYTTDGGNSWTRSLMPNMNIFGQITDIYFFDQFTGWAAIREQVEHGWSGIYKTTDGGKSWDLWYQAAFPVTIRQTSRSIFFTDRVGGIKRSTDGGLSFQTVAVSGGALGLDFLDDNTGISSSEGTFTAPVYFTSDGGNSWNPGAFPHEGWSAFADVAMGKFFIASERDVHFPSTQSLIFEAAFIANASQFNANFLGPGDAITGGLSMRKVRIQARRIRESSAYCVRPMAERAGNISADLRVLMINALLLQAKAPLSMHSIKAAASGKHPMAETERLRHLRLVVSRLPRSQYKLHWLQCFVTAQIFVCNYCIPIAIRSSFPASHSLTIRSVNSAFRKSRGISEKIIRLPIRLSFALNHVKFISKPNVSVSR